MYKCEKCGGQSEKGEPQTKIYEKGIDGQIKSEKKVCFYCKKKKKENQEK